MDKKWASLRIGEVRVTTQGGLHQIEAQLSLDELDPEAQVPPESAHILWER